VRRRRTGSGRIDAELSIGRGLVRRTSVSDEQEVEMQYLLTIHGDEKKYSTLTEDEVADIVSVYQALTAEMQERGAYIGSNRLAPASDASSVRVRDDDVFFTDAPTTETKEQLGGYFLIDVESLDEAIEWASRMPTARTGSVEVRPTMGLPADVEAHLAATAQSVAAESEMECVLLFYYDELARGEVPEEQRAATTRGFVALHDELSARYLAGMPLRPTETATTVRVREEETVVTDGPFAETKEQLGGFFLIGVDSVDEAKAWAAKVPSARFGTVEVRPVIPVQSGVTVG